MARLAIASEPYRFINFYSIVTFYLFVSSVVSGPAGIRSTSKCVSFCKETKNFAYEPGTTYVYDYATDISSSVLEESSKESRIHLKATAEITAISTCEFQLELKNVRIEDSDPQNANDRNPLEGALGIAEALEARAIRFAFQDGKIEQICSQSEDPVWVVNVKRGLLSILQNTMSNPLVEHTSQETDVTGQCLTTYQPTGSSWGNSETLKKTKDLTKCNYRHSHFSALQSVPYASNSLAQNIPLLSGAQECTQTVRYKKIEQVNCREEHKFQPFEKEGSGAHTIVVQTLVYSREYLSTASHSESSFERKSSLLYESQLDSDESNEDISAALSALESLERDNEIEVETNAANQFVDLVQLMRQINYDGLQMLLTRAHSDLGRKYLLDALPLVGTASSLKLMTELLLKGTLSPVQAETWLTSVAFIKQAQVQMISALMPLLENEPQKQAMLGISALINTYCRENESCDEEVIQDALKKIIAQIGTGCRSSSNYDKEETLRILVALKAIANAGRVPEEDEEEALGNLYRCFEEKSNPIEIRMAAIDAFRRMPCKSFDNRPMLSQYTDMKENTEVRIKAYLSVMRCPDRQIIDSVKETLYTDAINQVGSFVWTHLTNLQETSSPDKQTIRHLLSNDFLKNKFNTDSRKFSRNYEGVLFWDEINAGANVDANVIFTPESFIPRSTMLNLTVLMFGQSINVAEFEARLHSLEQLLEPVFGPEGYFPDTSMTDVLHSIRKKRDVSNNEIERLSSVYEQAIKGMDDSPGGSFSTKIFGHEVLYKNFEFSDKGSVPTLYDEGGKNWFDISRFLSNLSTGKKTEFTNSNIMMDISYTVATSAGIPLSLGVQSAATVRMAATGRFDVAKFLDKRELEIQGSLQPSASIKVDGSLTVQLGHLAQQIKSGLRLQNTLHSSTSVKGHIMMKGAKVIHASLSLPQDKQEIFEATSQLFIISPSGKPDVLETGPKGLPKFQHKMCTSERFSYIFGVKLCGEVDIAEDPTLISPAKAALYLEKTDTFTSYEFDYKFDNKPSSTEVSITFNTPGSSVDRKFSTHFNLDTNHGKMVAGFETPAKTFKVEGLYSKSQKSIQLTVDTAKDRIFLFNTNLRMNNRRIEPTLFITYYGRPIAEFIGVINLPDPRDETSKSNFDFALKHVTQKPVVLKGDVVKSGEKYDTNFEVDSYILSGNARSQFRIKPGHFSTKTSMHYSWKNSESKNLEINAKVQRTKKGALTRFNAAASFFSPQSPDWNFEFAFDNQVSTGFCENTVKFTLGKNTWDGHTLYNRQVTREQQETNLQLSLTVLKHGIDWNFEFFNFAGKNNVTAKITGRTNSENEIKAHMEYQTEAETLLKKRLTAEASWPGSDYTLRSALIEKSAGEFEAEFILIPNKEPEMKATITYINRSNNMKLDHSLEFRARGFTDSPFFGSAALSTSDKQSHLGGTFEVEGKKPGRWSTSLDYNIVKINAHKIEGKLTLNDKKYNGEINYRKTKTGDRIASIDLQLDKHMIADLKFSGEFPLPFTVSLSITPDVDENSEHKIVFHGTLTDVLLNINTDYFGEAFALTGQYQDTNLQIEAAWDDNQRFKLAINVPSFNFLQTVFSAKIETPFKGFQDCSLIITHHFNGNEMDSKIRGQVEQRYSEFSLSSLLNVPESRFSVLVDVAGYPKLESIITLGESGSQKTFELLAIRGDEQRKFTFEFTRLQGGYDTRLGYSGCTVLPQVYLELHHQITEQIQTGVKIEWIPVKSTRRQIVFKLTSQMKPFLHTVLLITPWKNFEKLEASVALKNRHLERELEINLDGTLEVFPILVIAKSHGDLSNFQNEAITTWKSGQRAREIRISSTGRVVDSDDVDVRNSIEFPDNKYELNFVSKKNGVTNTANLDIIANGEQTVGGITYHFVEDGKSIEVTAWGQTPSQPRSSFEFKHERNEKQFKIVCNVVHDKNSLFELFTNIEETNIKQWDVQVQLQSSFKQIPTVRLQSRHNMESANAISHLSDLRISPMPSYIWGVKENVLQANVRFNINDNKYITGNAVWGEETADIRGEFLNSPGKKNIRISVNPSFSKKIEITAGYEKHSGNSVASVFSASSGGEEIVHFKMKGEIETTKIVGDLDFHYTNGPHIVGSVLMDLYDRKIHITLSNHNVNWINFLLSIQVSLYEGESIFEIESSLHPLLEKIKLSLTHAVTLNGFEMEGKYLNKEQHYSIKGVGFMSDESKSMGWHLGGEWDGSLNIVVTGMDELTATVTYGGKEIYKIEAQYSHVKGEYALGKHTIKMLVNKNYQFIFTLGVDMNKVLMDIRTPFLHWTSLILKGEFDLQETSKILSFSFQKQEDVYKVEFRASSDASNGNILIRVESPFEGYRKLEGKLVYTIGKKSEVMLTACRDTQNVLLNTKWSPSDIYLAIKTPIKIAKHISLNGNWELYKKQKEFKFTTTLNEDTYEVLSIWNIQPKKGNAQVKVKIYETYDVSANYDFTKEFNILLSLKTTGERQNIGGRVALSEGSITVEAITPIPGYEKFDGKVLYNRIDGGYQGSLQWNIKEKVDTMEVQLILDNGKIDLNLQTPWSPWKNIKSTLKYSLGPKKALSFMAERDDGQKIELLTAAHMDAKIMQLRNSASAGLELSIRTPFEGFENYQMKTQYTRTRVIHNLNIMAAKNDEKISGKVQASFPSDSPGAYSAIIKADISAPYFELERSVDLTFVSKQIKTLKVELDLEGRKNVIDGLFELTRSHGRLEVRTSIPQLRIFKISAKHEAGKKFSVDLQANQLITEFKSDYQFQGLGLTKVALEIKSPISGFRHVVTDVHFRLLSGDVDTSFNFQNDWVRCMAKLNGSYSPEGGEFKLQINSPVYNYEQVVFSSNYTLKPSSCQLNAYMERNTQQELALETSLVDNELTVEVISKIPRFTVESTSRVSWNRHPFNIQLVVASGAEEYKGGLVTSIQGYENGNVAIDLPIKGWETFKFGWSVDGSISLGSANAHFDITKLGAYEVKSSWVNENWKEVEFEVWLKSKMAHRGIEAQYAVKREHFGATFSYTNGQSTETIAIASSLKKNGRNAKIMEFTLETPFTPLRKFSINGKLSNDHNTEFEVKLNHNEEIVINAKTSYTIHPLTSSVSVDLNAPILCEPFHANATYDLSSTNKVFNIFFTQSKYVVNITSLAVVPENSNEIELHINVDSNVPLVSLSTSGTIKAGYIINKHDDTRDLTVSFDSTHLSKWKVKGSIRPSTNFFARLEVDSPNENIIPSLSSEINWRGSTIQGISSDLFLQIGTLPQVKATFSLGSDNFRATFNSGISGFEDLSVQGVYDTSTASKKKLEVDVQAMEQNLSMKIDIQRISELSAKASFQITSTWEQIPNPGINLAVSLEENGNIVVTGNWGTRSVRIQGSVTGESELSLWRSANTRFSVFVDSVEKFSGATNHFIGNREYSFNFTLGSDYMINSYLHLNSPRAISTTVQYAQTTVKLNGETGPGKFSASFNSPWTKDFSTNGMYISKHGEVNAKLHFVYDKDHTKLEGSTTKKGNTYGGQVNIDIPLLKQKADCTFTVERKIEYEAESTEVKMKLNLLEKRLLLHSVWDYLQYDVQSFGKFQQRDISLTVTLPGSPYSDIRIKTSLKQPIGSCASLSAETSLYINSQTSRFALGYDIPVDGLQRIGFKIFADSAYISEEPIEFNIGAEQTNISKFDSRMQYKSNEINVIWDFSTLPQFKLETFANLPNVIPDATPYKLEVNGVFDLTREIKFKANVSCNHCYNFFDLAINRDTDGWTTRLLIDSPRFVSEKLDFSAKLNNKNSDRYFIDISGLKGKKSFEISGQAKMRSNALTLSSKMSGTFGTHFSQLQITQNGGIYEAEITAESMTFLKGKKVVILGILKPTENGFISNLECRTRKAIHSGSFSMNFERNRGMIHAQIESPDFLPITVDTNWEVQSSSIGGKIEISINENIHRIEVKGDVEDYEVLLNILCPYIPNKEFNFHLKFIVPETNFDILGDFKFDKSHWRLEGTSRYEHLRDMESKFEIRTTFEFLDRLTLAIKSIPEQVNVEIYTPVEAIPNVMFDISGLSSLEEGLWTNMAPKVILGLPCVSYSVSVTSRMPTNITTGEFGMKYEKILSKTQAISSYKINLETSVIREFDLELDNIFQIRFQLKSPFENLKSIEFLLGGKLGWETGAELKSLGDLNGKVIKFSLKLHRESESVKLFSELLTPFEGFEKYTFFVRLENYEEIGTGHSINIEFHKPGWEEAIQLELDYRYRLEGFADMEGEFSMSAPFFGIYPFTLHGESMMKSNVYNSIIEGKWENHNPAIKLEAGWSPEKTFVAFESKAGLMDKYHTTTRLDYTKGEHDFNIDFETLYKRAPVINARVIFSNPESIVEGKVFITTVWDKFLSANAIIKISPFSHSKETWSFDKLINTVDTKLGVMFNSKKIMNLELVSKDGKRILEIHNPLRPVSLTVKYDKESSHKLRLNAELCWNLKNPKVSTVGTESVLCRTSTGKDISVRIHGGHMGSLSANVSHLLTSSKLEQNVQLGWDLPVMQKTGELGYSIIFSDNSNTRDKKYDGVVKIFTPWRSMKVESRTTLTEKESSRFAEIQWDAKQDPKKKIGFHLVQKKTTAWRSYTLFKTLTLSYSGLEHDVIVASETGYKYNQFQYLEAALKPTPYKDSDLKIRFLKLSEDSESNGFNVVLTQPATNIYIEGQFLQSETDHNLNVKYMDVRGIVHAIQLRKTITDNGITIDVDAGQEVKLYKVFHFNINPNEDQYLLNLKTFEVEFDGSLKQNFTCLDLNLKYDTGKQLRLSAGMPNKKEISVKMWRDEYGKNTYDFIVALRLNTSQLISSTIMWRPELFDQIQESFFSLNAPKTIKEVIGNAMTQTWNVIWEELYERWNFFEPEMKQAIEDLIQTTRSEFNTIMKDVYRTWEFVMELYNKNIFYVQNVVAIFDSSFKAIYTVCEKSAKVTMEIMKSSIKLIREFILDIYKFWHKYAGEIEKIVMNTWDETERFIVTVWEENFEAVSKFLDYLEEVYEMIEDAIDGRIEVLEEKILAVSIVRKIIKWYQEYTTWIEELPIQDYIDDISDFFEEKIWRPLERHYKPYFDAVNKMFEGDTLPILDIPPLPYVRFVLKKAKEASNYILRIIEAEQKVKHLVRQSLKSFDGIVQRHVPTVAFVWDIDSGRIEYQQSLVFIMWEDFTQYPQWKRTQQDEDDLSKMSDLFYEVLDNFKNARPVIDMNIRDILPPFGTHAVMAGDYHYFTFDKKYFRFAGECSYVLAADLLHQNFSLIANYEQKDGDIRKKSYSLISNERFVEIDTSNFKVTLDGKKVELPLEVGPTFIRRQPSGLEVFDTRGFQMSCSLTPTVCTFSVSGWYFGKLAGLLGTYDNEQWNDFKTPDGQIVTDVSTFAHSWRVGKNSGSCRAKNYARDNAEKTDVDGICSHLLNDLSSPLRPCFNKVDTAIYTEMCMYDTTAKVNSAFRQEAACTAISAYVSECQKNNVDVWMPPSCVRCKLEDGTALTSGENATLESNGYLDTPKSSDVVLLIQESSCLAGISISEAMTKLDLALRAEGLMENRYAIVGFGGKGVHRKPHIRTSSSQVWAHSTLFKIPDNIEMDGIENGNMYEAIEYAASLGFRAGVSKTMIALTCGDEQCGDADQYADTLTLLIENDIKFHILAPKEFTMKANNKKQVDLYGIDINGVYTSHPSKRGNVEADTALKRQINLPKDLCTPLAMETNGTRFNVLQPTNKRFLDIWSRRISQTSQPSECQRCECVPDKNGRANLMCHQCVSPSLRRFMEDWRKYEYLDMDELLAADQERDQDQSNMY